MGSDLNSQPTFMDGPYAVSLDLKLNGQIMYTSLMESKPLVALYDAHWYTEDLFF